jgi:hypothetical protein
MGSAEKRWQRLSLLLPVLVIGKQALLYPVVDQNLRSRHLAECLGRHIISKGTLRKASGDELSEVIYRIPPPIPDNYHPVECLCQAKTY